MVLGLGGGARRWQEELEHKQSEIRFWRNEIEKVVKEKNFYIVRAAKAERELRVATAQHRASQEQLAHVLSQLQVARRGMANAASTPAWGGLAMAPLSPPPLTAAAKSVNPGSNTPVPGADGTTQPTAGQHTASQIQQSQEAGAGGAVSRQGAQEMEALRQQVAELQAALKVCTTELAAERSRADGAEGEAAAEKSRAQCAQANADAYAAEVAMLRQQLTGERCVAEETGQEAAALLADLASAQSQLARMAADLQLKDSMIELLSQQLADLLAAPSAAHSPGPSLCATPLGAATPISRVTGGAPPYPHDDDQVQAIQAAADVLQQAVHLSSTPGGAGSLASPLLAMPPDMQEIKYRQQYCSPGPAVQKAVQGSTTGGGPQPCRNVMGGPDGEPSPPGADTAAAAAAHWGSEGGSSTGSGTEEACLEVQKSEGPPLSAPGHCFPRTPDAVTPHSMSAGQHAGAGQPPVTVVSMLPLGSQARVNSARVRYCLKYGSTDQGVSSTTEGPLCSDDGGGPAAPGEVGTWLQGCERHGDNGAVRSHNLVSEKSDHERKSDRAARADWDSGHEEDGGKSEVGSTSGEGEQYINEQQYHQQAESATTAPGSALSTNKAGSKHKEEYNYLSVSLADNIALASPQTLSPAAETAPGQSTQGATACEATALEAGAGFCQIQATAGPHTKDIQNPSQNPTLEPTTKFCGSEALLPAKAVPSTSPFQQQQSRGAGDAASRPEGAKQQQEVVMVPRGTRGSSVAQIIARFSSAGGAGPYGSGGGQASANGSSSRQLQLQPWSSGGAGATGRTAVGSPTGVTAAAQQGPSAWSASNNAAHPLPPGALGSADLLKAAKPKPMVHPVARTGPSGATAALIKEALALQQQRKAATASSR